MSIYEASITNPKKQLEFYKQLSEQLQQENKNLNGTIQTYNILLKSTVEENEILKENAENNDKTVDKVNWKNMLLKKKNMQLKERIEYLERSNNRREDTILEQRQKISDLEDNWNKLKESIDIKLYNTEYLQKLWGYKIDDEIHMVLDIIKKEIKELEAKK